MRSGHPETAAERREWRRRHYYYSYSEVGWGWWCVGLWMFIGLIVLIAWATTAPPPPPPASAAAVTAQTVRRRISSESTAPRIRIERHWKQVSHGVYDIGDAGAPELQHGSRARVRGRAHMIYAKGFGPVGDALPPTANLTGPCVGPLGPGVRWRSTFKWVVDPTNGDGIPRKMVIDAMWNAANEFERRLPMGLNVVTGQDTTNCADGIDTDSPDNLNEIMLGFIEEPGVLAIMFGWTDLANALVSTDIVFNLHFPWGNSSVDPNVYDLCSVATHEMGHAYGLAHTSTALATMEPTAGRDETHKRNLLECEAAGLCTIYDQPEKACSAHISQQLAPFVDVGVGSRCGVGGSPPPSPPPTPSSAGVLSVAHVTWLACVATTIAGIW